MIACVPGIVALVLVFVVRRLVPQRAHPWFGYRSARSLRSEEAWEAAQPIAGEYMQWASLLVLNTGITCWLLEVPGTTGLLISTAALALLMIGVRVLTERALIKRFGR